MGFGSSQLTHSITGAWSLSTTGRGYSITSPHILHRDQLGSGRPARRRTSPRTPCCRALHNRLQLPGRPQYRQVRPRGGRLVHYRHSTHLVPTAPRQPSRLVRDHRARHARSGGDRLARTRVSPFNAKGCRSLPLQPHVPYESRSSGSRRLNAGHHLAGKRAPSRLGPWDYPLAPVSVPANLFRNINGYNARLPDPRLTRVPRLFPSPDHQLGL